MNHINNLKVKYLRVLLHYPFGSEELNGSPNKVKLLNYVNEVLESIGRVLIRVGVGRGRGML